MAFKYSQDECPCGTASMLVRTNHEDEAMVFDVVTELRHRCRLCGRRFTMQMVPGDYTVGGAGELVGRGYDGHPLLSMSAVPLQPEDATGKWEPRADD